jgi:hypothetical protein
MHKLVVIEAHINLPSVAQEEHKQAVNVYCVEIFNLGDEN